MTTDSGVRPLYWEGETFLVLDQRALPHRERYIRCTRAEEAVRAIREMAVRGAPAVGLTGAAAVALGARALLSEPTKEQFFRKFSLLCEKVKRARPTGYNLEWAVEVMRTTAVENAHDSILGIAEKLREKAMVLIEEDVAMNRQIGMWGREVIPTGARILTYCNAGALATGGYGTALGVVRAAWERDRSIEVYACETRPYLQGMRLTVYELMKDGIPVTLIPDNTAGYLMQRRQVDVVVVGADRITANGDVANKIGTYTLALLAKHHAVPFYVAAPRSTVDPHMARGEHIPIEERPSRELTHLQNRELAPAGARALYLAFDVTPHRYITGIITEVGVITKPFTRGLREALQR